MKLIRNKTLVSQKIKGMMGMERLCFRHVMQSWSGDTRRFWLLTFFAWGNIDRCERTN